MIRDIAPVAFDAIENCAVTVWTQNSGIRSKSMHHERIQALKKWSELEVSKQLFSKLGNALRAGIFINGGGSSPNVLIIIGYIFRCTVMDYITDASTSSLVIIGIGSGKQIVNANLSPQFLDELIKFDEHAACENDNTLCTLQAKLDKFKENMPGRMYHFTMKKRFNHSSLIEQYRETSLLFWEVVKVQKLILPL